MCKTLNDEIIKKFKSLAFVFLVFCHLPFLIKRCTVHGEKIQGLMQQKDAINSYPFTADNGGTEKETAFSSYLGR